MLALLLACSSPSSVPPDLARALDGTWTGQLRVAGAGLRLVLHFDDQGGSLLGTMDSPDQGATGIPLSGFNGTADNFMFRVPTVSGQWNGALRGDLLEGTWQQAGALMPLSFDRAEPSP